MTSTTVAAVAAVAVWLIVLILGVGTAPGRAAFTRFWKALLPSRGPAPTHRASRTERREGVSA